MFDVVFLQHFSGVFCRCRLSVAASAASSEMRHLDLAQLHKDVSLKWVISQKCEIICEDSLFMQQLL